MSTNNLEKLSSVCTTPKELITSDDFIKGLEIILEKVKVFDKDYILGLFAKLKNDEVLNKKEKDRLLKFFNNEKVEKKGKELLSKLKSVSVNLNINIENSDVFLNFSNLFNNIFAEDGYKKITKYVGEVADITNLILNPYEGMRKLQIEVNGETREIWLDNENLRVDSSDWEIEEIGGVKVKINPQGDITEFLEGKFKGEQLFTHQAALREAKKMGKRLAYSDNGNKEFQAIIDKVGVKEFMKIFPGYRDPNSRKFGDRRDIAYFWSAYVFGDNAYDMEFFRKKSKVVRYFGDRSYGLSVRLVKD